MKTSKRKWLEYGAGILTVLVMAALLVLILRDPQGVTGWLLDHMPEPLILKILMVILLYFLQGIVPFFMYNIVVLISSMVFSFPVAMAVNCFGTMACMVGPYWVGKYLRLPALQRRVEENRLLRRFSQGHTGGQFLLSYLLRAIGLSNTVLGVFFGSMGMPFWDFLVSGLLGVLPAMVCFSILGNTKSLRSPALWITLGIHLLIFLSAVLYFKRKERGKPNEPAPQS